MPPLSPAQSNIPTWFTEGDKDKGISWIGQDWLNILQAELLNILSEAGIKPDKGKLNQLTLSIKAIITANAYTQANNLKEIFDAGVEAQAAARGHLGLGRLATKDSLGPADVNALAKDQNLNDVPDKALARTALQLGNSATRNVGTTPGTVAAGDDSRITGAMQKDQNGADIPDKPGFIKNVGLEETVDQAAGAMQKSQNGVDILDAALFRRNIGVYDASTSQKGLVRLSGGVSDADDTLAATSGAVKISYDAAQLAWRLAASKYTAEGATTGKAGLVQLVNSMGGSGSLVMPQAAVTTAIQSYPSLGKGQTLQDLRGSRSIDATYTNSTGFPIAVYVRVSGGYSANLYAHVNGIELGGGGSTASNTSIATAFFIVPNGATYRVMASGVSIALQAWSELR
ncbi:tail fiber protein [Salmonella enterica]|nr:tail fiber protein [Salmonella enterica]